MYPEFIALIVFIVVLCVIEAVYIKRHELTISEHAQNLIDAMSKQIVAGIFFLLGALAGWFIAHFADTPIR
jgi:F0F1-type ATP synthase assembly protein I